MVQWKGQRPSSNVEDRRGEEGDQAGMNLPGGGGMRFPMPGGRRGGGIGIFGLLIALGLMLLFGIDPRVILGGGGGEESFPMPRVDTDGQALPKFEIPNLPGTKKVSLPGGGGPITANDDMKLFVTNVLGSTEDVWGQVFTSFGQQYREPKLVIFSGQTQTACGAGIAAMGPFYCPLDQVVYIDLRFYQEMKSRFGAPGDFAQAYVVAHEIGHHVQTLLGIAGKVQAYKQQVSEKDANALQVRMELQADCLAGIWANNADRTKGILEQGDVEEGLNAANAIGDDNLQKQATGRVVPDAFTHGSSEQRVRWFRRGLETGDLQACDTFNTDAL